MVEPEARASWSHGGLCHIPELTVVNGYNNSYMRRGRPVYRLNL